MSSSSQHCLGSPSNSVIKVLYQQTQSANVRLSCGRMVQKAVHLFVGQVDFAVHIKVKDTEDCSFNYATMIDSIVYESMRQEQLLELSFNELPRQVVELMKMANAGQMMMKCEPDETCCVLTFYQKSCIKSIVYLVIRLELTNRKEVISELSNELKQLKERERALSSELKYALHDSQQKDVKLERSAMENQMQADCFKKNLDTISRSVSIQISDLDKEISRSISKLVCRHDKLLSDIEVVRKENSLRTKANIRLMHSVQSAHLENEGLLKQINDLRKDMAASSFSQSQSKQMCADLQQSLVAKEEEAKELKDKVDDLTKDMKAATVVIAQKSQANDELGNDLVQANRLILNFNNQHEAVTQELHKVKEKLKHKDEIILKQQTDFERLSIEFADYRRRFNAESMKELHSEMFLLRQQSQGLEKQYRDTVKLNDLLTKKLSTQDFTESKR